MDQGYKIRWFVGFDGPLLEETLENELPAEGLYIARTFRPEVPVGSVPAELLEPKYEMYQVVKIVKDRLKTASEFAGGSWQYAGHRVYLQEIPQTGFYITEYGPVPTE